MKSRAAAWASAVAWNGRSMFTHVVCSQSVKRTTYGAICIRKGRIVYPMGVTSGHWLNDGSILIDMKPSIALNHGSGIFTRNLLGFAHNATACHRRADVGIRMWT